MKLLLHAGDLRGDHHPSCTLIMVCPSPQNTFNRFLTQITERCWVRCAGAAADGGGRSLAVVALLIIQLIRSMLIQSLH
jgi:hypothetical protein